MMRSPSSGCLSTTARSCAVSRPGFERIAAGMPRLAAAELPVAAGRDDAAAARALDRQRREGEHGIVRPRRRVDALVLVRAEDERLPPLAEPLRRLRGEAPLLGELLLLLR